MDLGAQGPIGTLGGGRKRRAEEAADGGLGLAGALHLQAIKKFLGPQCGEDMADAKGEHLIGLWKGQSLARCDGDGTPPHPCRPSISPVRARSGEG